MTRILCMFGFHLWIPYKKQFGDKTWELRECRACLKNQEKIFCSCGDDFYWGKPLTPEERNTPNEGRCIR